METKVERVSDGHGNWYENGTIVFEGKEFTSMGAARFGDRIIAYTSSDMKHVTSWGSEVLGTMRVTSSWKMPYNCWISDRQYQVVAVIDGKRYTGRTMGGCMIVRLREMKGA